MEKNAKKNAYQTRNNNFSKNVKNCQFLPQSRKGGNLTKFSELTQLIFKQSLHGEKQEIQVVIV